MCDGKDQQSLVHIGDIGPDKFVLSRQQTDHIPFHRDTHRIRNFDLNVISDQRFDAERPEYASGSAPVDLTSGVHLIKPGNTFNDLPL